MISGIYALPIGNALRVRLSPPSGALAWRVLRKDTDTIASETDASALVVYQGNDLTFLDTTSLANDATVFYRPFYFDGTVWTAGASAPGLATADYEDLSTDVLEVVRDRIEAGLQVEVARKRLNSVDNYIQVMTAPPPVDSVRLPVVSVHLDSESPQERGLGEDITGIDEDFIDDQMTDSEGWLAQVQLTVCGWSLNPDERIELRKALRRIIVGNLPVFAENGFQQVTLSQRDEDILGEEMGTNIYQAMCSFSCLAPVRVGRSVAKPDQLEISIGSTNDVENPNTVCDCIE